MKAIGYIRASTDDQRITLEAQESKIRAYCTLNEIELVGIEIDGGEFSGDLDRPGVQRVIEMVKAREVGAVVIAKLDRLSRSTRDTDDLMALFRKYDVKLIDIESAIDLKNATGRLLVGLRSLIAQFEREQIGERTSAALQQNRSKGVPAGEAPFGWIAQPRTKQQKDEGIQLPLLPNEAERALLTRMQQFRAAGGSLSEIAELLNREGHRTRRGGKWSKQGVDWILKNAVAEKVAA